MCRDTGIDLKCRKERKGYLFAWGVDNKHQSCRHPFYCYYGMTNYRDE